MVDARHRHIRYIAGQECSGSWRIPWRQPVPEFGAQDYDVSDLARDLDKREIKKDILKCSYLSLVIEPIVEKAHDVGLHGCGVVVCLSHFGRRSTHHSGVLLRQGREEGRNHQLALD